jgi:hypothetical protein
MKTRTTAQPTQKESEPGWLAAIGIVAFILTVLRFVGELLW